MSRRCRPGWYLRRRGRAVVAGHRCDGVYICSCCLGRAPPRGVRMFAAQSVRAKICVSWQPLAVVQRQPSARAATFVCDAKISKNEGWRAGFAACTHAGASRRRGRVFRVVEQAGGCTESVVTKTRGPRDAARATTAGKELKPRDRPGGVFEASLWVRSGSSGYLD